MTHDQTEALSLAQRIAVMNNGRIVQEGGPRDIYAAPASPFVAEFIGGANVVAGTVVGRDGRLARVEMEIGGQSLAVEIDAAPGESVKVLLRPEAIRLSASPLDGGNVLTGTIRGATFIGYAIDYTIELAPGLPLRVMAPADVQIESGALVWLGVTEPRALRV